MVGRSGGGGWIAGVLLLAACGGNPYPVTGDDIALKFGDRVGTFVLLDGATGRAVRHDATRAAEPLLPASTFKIANALIALDAGVAPDSTFTLTRDSVVSPPASWWPAGWSGDHDLASALRGSVVWYYQEIARRIGEERMASYLQQFGYGNASVGGGIDAFWLTGGLRISADEQVEFLRRFHRGELGVSARATETVKALLVMEETPAYRLSGKTGWAGFGDPAAPQMVWLVGYLERDGAVDYFAMNLDIAEPADAAARLEITKGVLRAAGRLPDG